MKKTKKLLLNSLILSCLFITGCSCSNNPSENVSSSSIVSTSVETFKDDRLVLTTNDTTKTVSVKINSNSKNTDQKIVIPSTYYGNPVVEVENSAFEGLEFVPEIIIPSSVTRIGKDAFKGCLRIQKLSVPFVGEKDGQKENSFIGYWFGETRYSSYALLPTLLKDVTIENSSTIPEGAFYGLESLENISVSNDLSFVGDNAFYLCNKLVTTEYMNAKYIGNKTNSYVALIDLKDDASEIFTHENTKVVKLNKDFKNITKITLNKNVTQFDIENTGLEVWNALKELTVSDQNTKYDSRENCNAIIEKSSNKLILGCSATRITKDIETIGKRAFEGKYYVKNTTSPNKVLTIPSSVKTIEEGAFYNCNDILNVQLSDGMTKVDSKVFGQCININRLYIPKGIRKINDDAFEGLTKAMYVYFGCSETEYNNDYIEMPTTFKNLLVKCNKSFDWKA